MTVQARILDANALREIAPLVLRAYAQAQGWHRLESYGEHSDVYGRQGAGEVIIPASDALADYAQVMSQVIALFAKDEGRDELQVYNDLTTSGQDVVRVRAADAKKDGSVRLNTGVNLVVNARSLLLSAACSATDPRPTYRAGGIKEAADYMNRVRLGQTERSSFTATLLSPVPPSLESRRQATLWPTLAEDPYERQVTRKLVDGLQAARDSIEKANRGDGFEVFEMAVKIGVSANLCEAAASLIEAGEGLDVSVTWARTRLTPERRRQVSFKISDASVLKEAARRFRDREPRPDERLEGYIVHLDREKREREGSVTLRTLLDGRQVSVRMELPENEYSIATQAHDKRSALSLVGDLVREGHRWRLESPRQLAVLEVEDETESDPKEGDNS